MLRHVSFALRQLRRVPGYSLAVVLTLALAIGANTAVFSVLDAFLLRRLPYPEPDRVGALITHKQGVNPQTGSAGVDDDDAHDRTEWRAVREQVPALLAATSSGSASGVNIQAGRTAQYVIAQRVSADYFAVLGIEPLLGRAFTAQEDTAGGPQAAVLSYALWQSAFQGDPQILGKPAIIKGEPYTIVGVLANTLTPSGAALWVPQRPDDPKGECAGGDNCHIFVRLRPGATWDEARAQLGHVRLSMFDELRAKAHGSGWFYVRPLQLEMAQHEDLSLADPMRALMLAVGLILLIACANLAGLALVRMHRRVPEMATRLALGAGRADLLLELWLESLLLALAGASIGVVLARLLLEGAKTFLPLWMQPMGGFWIDARVLGFAIALSIGTSVLFGLLPALELRRVDIRAVLAAGSRGVAGGRSRLRQWLIGAEVAVTIVLLASAGLLVRTLVHLETLPPGFNSHNVMTAKASLDDARYHDAAHFQSLMVKSVAAMRAIPGVEEAAVGLSLPYERGLNDGFAFADGPNAGHQAGSSVVWVTPAYFETLRIPILLGRGLRDSDTANSEEVIVVNQAFAKQYFGKTDAIGHRLKSGHDVMTIVGVVADVAKAPGMDRGAPISTEPVYYLPAAQASSGLVSMASVWFQPSWIVRTRGPVANITGQMQQALTSVDPALPFSGFYSMGDIEAEQLQFQRIEVVLLTSLAGLALVLSMIGVYSLVANLVIERTREIGIRLALGSTIGRAMRQIGAAGLVASCAGTAVGLTLSLYALRLLKSQIYGVAAWDPLTLTVVPLTLLLLAAVASTAPVLRIARIDPADILRSE